jgi:hypothetical protein
MAMRHEPAAPNLIAETVIERRTSYASRVATAVLGKTTRREQKVIEELIDLASGRNWQELLDMRTNVGETSGRPVRHAVHAYERWDSNRLRCVGLYRVDLKLAERDSSRLWLLEDHSPDRRCAIWLTDAIERPNQWSCPGPGHGVANLKRACDRAAPSPRGRASARRLLAPTRRNRAARQLCNFTGLYAALKAHTYTRARRRTSGGVSSTVTLA